MLPNSQEVKYIYVGTPEFGANVLEGLLKKDFRPVLVITNPDKPVGRKLAITPPPVKLVAEKYKIPILQTEKIETLKNEITNQNPDLIVVAAFGQIIPKDILDIPKSGSINVHPSLLPKYRGASPIQSAILNGEKKTGVTVMLIDEKMDHGPIISQRTIVMEEKETARTLSLKLAEMGANLLSEVVPRFVKKMLIPRPQQDIDATFTKMLTKEAGRINWKKPAEEIEREIRAYSDWPGSYTFWNKKGKDIKIDILKARVQKSSQSMPYPLGKVMAMSQGELGVQCGKMTGEAGGNVLIIEVLKMEGGKETSPEDFLNGHPDFIGAVLN